MITNTPRTWIAGSALLTALLVVACWFLLISPARASVTDAQAAAASAESANDTLAAQVTALRQEYVSLPAQQAELASLQAHVPDNLALSTLTRTITSTASAAGVTLMSLAPATPALDTGTTGTTTTTSTTVSSSLAIEVVGSMAQAQVFLEDLQTMDRDFLVTGLTLTAKPAAKASVTLPTTRAGAVTLDVTGSVFVRPAVVRSTTAGAATTTATASASSTAASTASSTAAAS